MLSFFEEREPRVRRRLIRCRDREEPSEPPFRGEVMESSEVADSMCSTVIMRSMKVSGKGSSDFPALWSASCFHARHSSALGKWTSMVAFRTWDLNMRVVSLMREAEVEGDTGAEDGRTVVVVMCSGLDFRTLGLPLL